MLSDIPVKRVNEAQQKAILRMHLYVTGETHQRLIEVGRQMREIVLDEAGGDGKIDGLGMDRAQRKINLVWKRFFDEWMVWVTDLRKKAAMVPFGTMAVYQRWVKKGMKKAEGRSQKAEARMKTEALGTIDFVFSPQWQAVLKAADQRIWGDGLRLSQRVWNLNKSSLEGLSGVLAQGVANSMSAYDIAEGLQMYLGAGQDCPRWTRSRLQITKKEIAAGRRTGLYSGEECAGQGVAYKALRMARTEIQAVHHMASDRVMGMLPFVEKEQIRLSPAHPEDDICDETIAGGEDGQGIYPKGEIGLPLHPNCLCYKTAVLMDEDEFTGRLRGWMDGSQPWEGMDGFAEAIGGDVNVDLTKSQVAQHLDQWAFEDPYSFN
jgi:hypothetical protein